MEAKAEEVKIVKAKEGREKEEEKKKKPKKKRIIEVKKVAKKWEIWDDKEEAAKSEEKAKMLVPEKFHKWVHILEKKTSERMPMRKMWDHAIKIKKWFVLKKGKIYMLLLREKREEMYKFIKEQLRKGYIRLSKLPQMASVFFVGKMMVRSR